MELKRLKEGLRRSNGPITGSYVTELEFGNRFFEIEFKVRMSGSSRPATRMSPAEEPDIEVEDVVATEWEGDRVVREIRYKDMDSELKRAVDELEREEWDQISDTVYTIENDEEEQYSERGYDDWKDSRMDHDRESDTMHYREDDL